jgi:hypothetical protein
VRGLTRRPPAPQTHAFVKHAGAVMAWDRQILENRRFLVEVEGLLARAMAGQQALDKKLSTIETSQQVGAALARRGRGRGRSRRPAGADGASAGGASWLCAHTCLERG